MSVFINAAFGLALVTAPSPRLTAVQYQPDSHTVLKELRSQQARFERIRRRHLPLTHRGSRGECDERIGRFCFWHEDDAWKPHEEHPRITAERDELLAELASAANTWPFNEWIAGQRVRYLVEVNRHQEALDAARACQHRRWWCFALEGLVLHETHDFAGAEGAFATALGDMPRETRDAWSDVSLLLDESERGRYRQLTSEERTVFEQRFWWFADPFFLTPGNERKTEHYARLTYGEILAASALTRRMRWGRDNREMLVRYGRTVGWERERTSMSLSNDYLIIGHHLNGGRRFAPPFEYVSDPSNMHPGDWELDPFRAQTRYATGYARKFGGFEHQLATFRRGDSAVVVAVARPQPIKDERRDSAKDASKEGDDEAHTIHYWFATSHATPPRGTSAVPETPIAITTPIAPTLVSIETVNAHDSVAWRERHWLNVESRLPDGLSVSDPLLLHHSEPLPTSLDQAVALATTSIDVNVERGITIFFEVYGLRPGVDPLDVSLTVAHDGKGFLRKAAEFMGVVYRTEDRVTMRWSEQPVAWGEVTARAVTVQLRDDMSGAYALTLVVRNADGTEAIVKQRVRVRRP